MLDKNRCPWCGHEYDRIYRGFHFNINQYAKICSYCNKYAVNVKTKKFLISLLLLFFSYTYGAPISFVFPVAASILFLYFEIKTPLERSANKDKDIVPETIIGYADIKWLDKDQTGIWFMKWRIWNYSILPLCFCDKDGMILTQTVCIRICKNRFRWKNFYQLRLINDEFDITNVSVDTMFYLFQKKKKVGVGHVISVDAEYEIVRSKT